jgi:ppGpp synthetase/RelA/SpoT-type nucleotidyltranferase
MIAELRECAEIIAQTDVRMQKLHKAIRAAPENG